MRFVNNCNGKMCQSSSVAMAVESDQVQAHRLSVIKDRTTYHGEGHTAAWTLLGHGLTIQCDLH